MLRCLPLIFLSDGIFFADLSAAAPVAFRLFADDGIVLQDEWMVYAVLIALWLLVTACDWSD